MNFSFFLKIFDCPENPDYRILFSTRKASVVRLHKETLKLIAEGRISDEEGTLLRDLEIITEDQDKEKKDILNYLADAHKEINELDLTIITTLDCNFNCTYCFEGNLKDDRPYLSDETATGLEKYIKGYLDSGGGGVFLTYYGGEPLLNYRFIRSFSERIREYTGKKGKSFAFSMITNGSLFTRKKAKELKSLGLTHIQTTLDGMPESHNLTRPFRSGKGSFDAVLENIKETCDIVRIDAGGNYDKHNIQAYLDLIPFLANEGLGPDRLGSLKFSPVMKNIYGYNNGCIKSAEDWATEADIKFRETLLMHGYSVPNLKPLACAIEHPHILVMNWNGDLYKCPMMTGNEEFIVGNIKEGVKNYDRIYNVGLWKNETCLNCEYLPLCFGGCRYFSFLQYGHTKEIDCRKPVFDANLEKYIRMDIEYGNI